VRDDKILAQSFGFGHFHFMKEPEIWQSIEQHKDKVLAILSGHLHLSGTVCVNSVYQIVAAGTSFPHDSVLYTVYKDRIDVEFKNPPSHLWEAYTTSCYGTFRYRQMIKEYSDAEHPEHLTYLTGNPSERRFSIAMK